MNLIVDIGNTLTKIALVDAGEIVHVERFKKVTRAILGKILKDYSPEKTIISAVGKYQHELYRTIFSSITTIELNPATKIPATNLYQTPQTLGNDRIAAAVGAATIYPKSNILIIDCGTAITYDLINQLNEYLGGAISPGIRLRFNSLHNYTTNLPLLQAESGYPLVGKNTKDCILSGVLNGTCAEIDNYISRIKEQQPDLKTLITGGDANFFADKLKSSIFVVQNLVIIGLNRILEFNA